jgi:uncharacterized protein
MLLSYSFSNFHSFAETTKVSFVLNQRDTVHGWDRTSPSGERVTTAMAVLGANGAGKSNLIKVGPFVAWFVSNSFSLQPEEPLAFTTHQMHMKSPAKFEVELDDPLDGTRWLYKLRASENHVEHESLQRRSYNTGSRYSYVFERDWNGKGYDVKQQGFGLADAEAAKVRPNVSLISWGKQYGAELAIRAADLHLSSNLRMLGRDTLTDGALFNAAEFFSSNEPLQTQMRTLLKSWDLGLSDVRLHQYDNRAPGDTNKKRIWYPMGVHESKGSKFELPFDLESTGTQTALALLWRLLPVLADGGVAFIDELESDLHPHMIEPILRLFHDRETNPHDAQIIFTCQSPEVLKILQRAQVIFVEKVDCASTAYRGDEIEGLTSAQNLYAKYMSGALGAVPQV